MVNRPEAKARRAQAATLASPTPPISTEHQEIGEPSPKVPTEVEILGLTYSLQESVRTQQTEIDRSKKDVEGLVSEARETRSLVVLGFAVVIVMAMAMVIQTITVFIQVWSDRNKTFQVFIEREDLLREEVNRLNDEVALLKELERTKLKR